MTLTRLAPLAPGTLSRTAGEGARRAIVFSLSRIAGEGGPRRASDGVGEDIGAHPIDPHRPRDVLQRRFADIVEIEIEPARGVLLNPRRDADAARLGNAFEPRRDIDPVAENVAVLDDVALVDADA